MPARGEAHKRLRWLSLAGRGGYVKGRIGKRPAQRLVMSPFAGRLVHLDLSNQDLGDAFARHVARSPHLGRLVSLNLWHNQIGPAGGRALAKSDNLPSLLSLDLRSNQLTDPVCRQLRERFGAGVRYGKGRMLTDEKRERQARENEPVGEEDGDEIPF